MTAFIDIHSHHPASNVLSVVNCFPEEVERFIEKNDEQLCSVGLHPWMIDADWEEKLQVVAGIAAHERVVAIGETGLDRVCDTPLELQGMVFRRHVAIAEQVQKPVIIHCVRAFNEIASLHNKLCPKQAWLIHGFRGRVMQARQLIEQGFYLSFGKGIEQLHDTIQAVPLNRIFLETDDGNKPIAEIYRQFALQKNISIEALAEQISVNFDAFRNQSR
ncbi:MAG: TatD family hydrolase [Prevotellaceae bacterium]|jgi:TatD DNase family protein|nr:TatD family hydrolase [Prevotellaceae bacterium]